MPSKSGPKGEKSDRLSPEKIAAAQGALSVEQRMALARNEGSTLSGSGDIAVDPKLRAQIMTLIAHDAESLVRLALAQTLAQNASAPRDIILKLANDDDLVARAVLAHSKVLTDADLVAIVLNQGSQAKMAAMAERNTISTQLSDALIDCGDATVVAQVVRNPGAVITESGFMRAVDRHGEIREIQTGLIDRRALPASIIERMVKMVAEDLLQSLVEHHEVPLALASQIVSEVHERAALGLTAGLPSDALMSFIEQLEEHDGITYALVLRSLCAGNLEFIIHVIAMRCSLSTSYVRERLESRNPDEIRAIWRRGNMPEKLQDLAVAVVSVLQQSQIDAAKFEDQDYRGRIIERVLSACAEMDATFSEADVDFILDAKFGTGSARRASANSTPPIRA